MQGLDHHDAHTTEPRAASYARSAAVTGDGLVSQHETNAHRAAGDGWRVPESVEFRFTDDGDSGLSVDRPGLNALLHVVTRGQAPFSRLYVRDRERLFRGDSLELLYWFEHVMRSHGVEVRYVADRVGPSAMSFAALLAARGSRSVRSARRGAAADAPSSQGQTPDVAPAFP